MNIAPVTHKIVFTGTFLGNLQIAKLYQGLSDPFKLHPSSIDLFVVPGRSFAVGKRSLHIFGDEVMSTRPPVSVPRWVNFPAGIFAKS